MSPLDLRRKKEISKVMAGSLAAGAGFLVVAQLLTQHIAAHPDEPATKWLAILPILLLVLLVVLALRNLRRMDELERRMHTEAMAFAFMGSLLLVAAYATLATVDLIRPPLFWLLPGMMLCWNIGLMLAVDRYR